MDLNIPEEIKLAPTISETNVVRALLKLLNEAGASLETDGKAAKACIDRASALIEATAITPERPAPPPQPDAGRCLAAWQARRVVSYVEENIASPIRVSELAGQARLSVSYFSCAFKARFGAPPQAYILGRRIELAQELMLTTDDSLSQISLACGFSDQAHFCRLFHREAGATPRAWRRNHQGDVGVR